MNRSDVSETAGVRIVLSLLLGVSLATCLAQGCGCEQNHLMQMYGVALVLLMSMSVTIAACTDFSGS